jgi:carbamoyltransferase
MLLVGHVYKEKNIPAVTHVNNSARIQTINAEQNFKYYNLIKKFYEETNCPVIINTSFNVRGEPIVRSPQDAFNCFVNTDIDYLVMGNYIISKKENLEFKKIKNINRYLQKFKLD